MKISEIISESEDWIKAYFGLHNINIDDLYKNANILFDRNAADKENAKIDLLGLFSYVDALLRNPDWENLEDDPDYERVYNGLLDLHEHIQQAIKQ